MIIVIRLFTSLQARSTLEGPSTVMERVPAPTLEVSMTKEDRLPAVPLSTPKGDMNS